jgi:hypothetical protein
VRNNTNVYIIFLQLSVFLLMKHTFDVIYGTEEYPFSVFTVLTLKAIGILLPMFIIIRTISTIQKTLRRRHQYPVSSFPNPFY